MKYLVFILLSACTANEATVKRILEDDGCTHINLTGYAWFSCGDDVFANSFECYRNGKNISGAVCSGLLKGYTIRYE